MNLTVALDAMGGDHGPPVIVPAAFRVLEGQPELHLILVGDRSTLEREIARLKREREQATAPRQSAGLPAVSGAHEEAGERGKLTVAGS